MSDRLALLTAAVEAGSYVFLCDEEGCHEFVLVGPTNVAHALWLRSFPEEAWGWAMKAGWQYEVDRGRWLCQYHRRSAVRPAVPRP